MGGTLVVRPDSGDPETVPIEVIQILAEKFGFTVNSKGYKVLHPSVRVSKVMASTKHSLPKILANLKKAGFSADNIAFRYGGRLAASLEPRYTLKYAMKASAIRINEGEWIGFSKDPITDAGKQSKEGKTGINSRLRSWKLRI
jgi:nicotinamide phosphoribosyltransferase